MSLGTIVYLLKESVLEILIISAPILIVGMLVGLIISILQATTSIQEQTLTFVPKIAAIFIVIAVTGPWMFTRLAQFTIRIFERIPDMVR